MEKEIEGYEIIRQLGKGTYGVAYLVKKEDKYYVLKDINNVKSKKDIENIKSEKYVLDIINCQSPNLLCLKDYKFFESGNIINRAIFIVEYIENIQDLSYKIINKKEDYDHFSFPEFQKIINGVINGLSILHGYKILHLDIKPDNILATNNLDKIYLIDYGLSCILKEDNEYCSSSEMRGSYNYIAPEFLKGKYPNRLSDIFSLGVLITTLISYNLTPIFEEEIKKSYYKIDEKERMPFKKYFLNTRFYIENHNAIIKVENMEKLTRPEFHKILPFVHKMLSYNNNERPNITIVTF